MPRATKAWTPFTGQYNWITPKLCDYYWNTVQISMFVTNWVAPHPGWGHQEIAELLSEFGAESAEK